MRHPLLTTCLAAAVVTAGCLGAAAPASAAAPARSSTVSAALPPFAGPVCPSRAPRGAVFLRHVQPPFGKGYDLYRYAGQQLVVYC